MKTKEELKELKQEYEELTAKLNELTEEELKQISVGVNIWDVATKIKPKFNNHDEDTLNW